MSSNLCWQPVQEKWHDLPLELKCVLQKRYEGTANAFMNAGDIPYLEGLKDSGIKGAKTLIDAIEKYSDIEIKEFF